MWRSPTPSRSASLAIRTLGKYLVALLTSLRRAQLEERMALGLGRDPAGYVFTNELGEPLAPNWVSARFDDLVREAGLPRIRLHDARHTAARQVLAAGVQPKIVQEMLGHADVRITLGFYGHATPTMGREARAATSATLLR